MSSFILKLIAMVTMFIDHLGDTCFKQVTAMNVIGRIAFPIFAFQISEGYIHTKNLTKYFLRLFLFAFISQIPFMLFLSLFSDSFSLNIFFTLSFGLLAILVYDKICNCSFSFDNIAWLSSIFKHVLAILVICFIGIVAQVCPFDYGFFGIAIIALFHIFKNNKLWLILSFTLACILKYGFDILCYGYHYLYILLCLFTILPIILICLYNKKQGKKVKYFLYFFYPVHLLLLYFIFTFVLQS